MDYISLFLTAVGLSMDAFAVAICKGVATKSLKFKHMFITALYFGGFQALMPLLGYLFGVSFENLIKNVDHWVAFTLLCLIGINMIRESFEKEDECKGDCEKASSVAFKVMLPLAIATSIDALAVGISFAVLDVNIVPAVIFIGLTTFTISFFGVIIGNAFGSKFKSKAEMLGGIILIIIGIKILVEHLDLIGKIFN